MDENIVDFCGERDVVEKSSGGTGLDYLVTTHGLLEINLSKETVKRSLITKQRLCKIACKKDSSLIAIGGTTINIVDVKTWKIVETFSGHATEIQDLIFASDGTLYSCSKDDRFISAWTLKSKKAKVFVSESPPLKLSLNSQHLMAHLENGQLAIWNTTSNAKSVIGMIELNIQDSKNGAFGFLSASFAADDHNIFFTYGSNLQPLVEKYTYLSSDDSVQDHVVLTRFLPSSDRNGEMKQKKVKTSPQSGVATVQPVEEEQEVSIPQEESLADRVKALQILKPVQSKQASQTSLQALLAQAIHSGDDGLLEKALQVGDKKVIHATIMRTSPAHILMLLDQIVLRLQKKPNRAAQLVEWIRACLLHHSGYLLSVPHLTHRLANLHRTLDSRKDAIAKLMKLSGRLDIVVSQMDVVPFQHEEENALVFTADLDEDENESNSDGEMEDQDVPEYGSESESDGSEMDYE